MKLIRPHIHRAVVEEAGITGQVSGDTRGYGGIAARIDGGGAGLEAEGAASRIDEEGVGIEVTGAGLAALYDGVGNISGASIRATGNSLT